MSPHEPSLRTAAGLFALMTETVRIEPLHTAQQDVEITPSVYVLYSFRMDIQHVGNQYITFFSRGLAPFLKRDSDVNALCSMASSIKKKHRTGHEAEILSNLPASSGLVLKNELMRIRQELQDLLKILNAL